MYSVGFATVIAFPIWNHINPLTAIVIGFIFTLPTAVDGTTQMLTHRESTNRLRVLTGSLLGFAVPTFLWGVVSIAS